MAVYRSKIAKRVIVLSFDELVQHGIDQGVPVYNGYPWSFDVYGFPVTHENNDQYIVGDLKLNRGEYLLLEDKSPNYFERNFSIISQSDLNLNYEKVSM